MMSTDQHIQQNMNDNSNNSNNSNNNNTNNNNNNQSVNVNVNNTNNNTQTISNLSAGLKSVSLTDQQQNEVNLNLLQQQLHQEASTQQQQSRITQFFQNQPTEGFTLFSHRSALMDLKLPYIIRIEFTFNTFLDFNNGEQRTPEFVTINPNARVPALIDHYNDNTSIWESGAIVSKYLKENGECSLWSNNLIEQSQISSWLFFQTSGHAPMIGQAF